MTILRIKIPHVSFRDGRPRFNPGPKIRRLKMPGKDLRHPDGRWYTAEEAAAWVRDELEPELESRRADRGAGRRLRVRAGSPAYRIADLFADWYESPAFTKRLEPKTQTFYRQNGKVLECAAAGLWGNSAAALTKPTVFNTYEALLEAKGVATARAVVATLSTAISWGMKRGKVLALTNPCNKLGMEGAKPRVRAGEVEEMQALVAAADAIGRPEVGDMIMLGLWSGQRQADRLALLETAVRDGRRYYRQQKTGAIVMMPDSPELSARLDTARERRKAMTVQFPHVVVDENNGRPFMANAYRKLFAEVRATAVEGTDTLEACPSLRGFTDQDLRDTAVTWLARAGATEGEIAAITGHSLASIKSILKHYLALHPEMADHGMAKMVAWYQGKTGR